MYQGTRARCENGCSFIRRWTHRELQCRAMNAIPDRRPERADTRLLSSSLAQGIAPLFPAAGPKGFAFSGLISRVSGLHLPPHQADVCSGALDLLLPTGNRMRRCGWTLWTHPAHSSSGGMEHSELGHLLRDAHNAGPGLLPLPGPATVRAQRPVFAFPSIP